MTAAFGAFGWMVPNGSGFLVARRLPLTSWVNRVWIGFNVSAMLQSLARHVRKPSHLFGAGEPASVAEVVPIRHFQFRTDFRQPEKPVADDIAGFAAGSGGDFPAVDMATDVVFGAVCMRRDLRMFEDPQQLVSVGKCPLQLSVQAGMAGARGERVGELASKMGHRFRVREFPIAFEVAI